MTTEQAKELLTKLGIPKFSVLEWNSVWKKIRSMQIAAYDQRDHSNAEQLCNLERFIESNGGEVDPKPIQGGYFKIILRR